MLKGSGAVVSSALGGEINQDVVILIMTGMFLVYGIAGGLSAAIVTDFIQGILTVVFSFVLVPVVMDAVGGFDGLHDKITNSEMFNLRDPEITTFFIVVISINALIGIVTQPHTMGNCAAGRTELDGRIGFGVGNFVKRFCTMAWCVTGLAAVAYLAGRSVKPDNVYGVMAREFFPDIMPGLLGIFLASLLASVMSSCDSFMIASSALLTENIYKPFRPDRPQKHYLLVGRIVSLLIVTGGLLYAYWLRDVIEGIEIFWKIAPMMGIVFWLGLFWRRMTAAGAWAATLAGFGTWFLTTQDFFIDFAAGLSFADRMHLIHDKAIYMPWQMIFYLCAGLIAGIVVSLFTKPVSEDKLRRFYELVRTPVNKGEGQPPEPCVIPEGVEIPPKRLVTKRFGLEIMVPSAMSVIGFILSWTVVVLLIYGFYAITR
jgi:Na+/proline symporter